MAELEEEVSTPEETSAEDTSDTVQNCRFGVMK